MLIIFLEKKNYKFLILFFTTDFFVAFLENL